MIKLNPLKPKFIKFKMEVSGNTDTPIPRLVLMSKNFNLVFDGVCEDGLLKVNIPVLESYYKDLTGKAVLEVIVDGFLFKPWEGELLFESPPQVNVKIEDTEESKVRVSASIEEDDLVQNITVPKVNVKLEQEKKGMRKLNRTISAFDAINEIASGKNKFKVIDKLIK